MVEKDFFDLWIEQDNSAEVGDKEEMDFYVKSYFGHGMTVNISIILETPSNTNETLYSDNSVYIDVDGSWDHSIDYNFTEEGYYYVYFILIDDIGAEWYELCKWEIEEPGVTTSDHDTDTVPSLSPGFEGFFVIAAIAVVALLYRKKHV